MRSNSRQARAIAKQQKNLAAADWSWKIWKKCEICGVDFCVNCAWEDRKPRTPKYQGIIVCLRCDPRSCDPVWGYPHMAKRIRNKYRYKMVMALVIARKVAKMDCLQDNQEGCKCIPCAAATLIERTE